MGEKNIRIVRGPNSAEPSRIVVDEHAQLLTATLRTDYAINQTKLSHVEALVDGTNTQAAIATVRRRLEILGHTQASVRNDKTRTDGGKLVFLATKVATVDKDVRKLLGDIETEAAYSGAEAGRKLFSSKLTLTPAELQILPLMAKDLKKDEATFSESAFGQSEARILMTMINDYPSMINPKQIDPESFNDIRTEFDGRFTPEHLETVNQSASIFAAIRTLKADISEAGSAIAPREVLESINATRVK